MITDALDFAQRLSALFSALPQVEAVALGGSRGSGALSTDATSDIDLYIYTHDSVPLEERQRILEQSGGATQANLNLNYWGLGDEWYHAFSGIEVDIGYFDAAWTTGPIDRVIHKHQASLGYTPCYWYTVRQSIVLSDPRGWYRNLQRQCAADYAEELRQAIIALNHPVLRGIIPAYAHQVEKRLIAYAQARCAHLPPFQWKWGKTGKMH